MHKEGPLQGHEGPLDRRQQHEGQDHREREPQRGVKPHGRAVGHLDGQNEAHHDMAHDDNREVGRRVVGAVMVQGLAAMGTIVRDLEVAAKQGSGTAGRAFQRGAAEEGLR